MQQLMQMMGGPGGMGGGMGGGTMNPAMLEQMGGMPGMQQLMQGMAIFLTFIIVFFNVLFGLNIFVTFSKHTTYCKICKRCQKEEVAPTRSNSSSRIAALKMKARLTSNKT